MQDHKAISQTTHSVYAAPSVDIEIKSGMYNKLLILCYRLFLFVVKQGRQNDMSDNQPKRNIFPYK